MRIAHVTFRFDAPGGVETNVMEVARGLVKAGDDVSVFSGDLYDEDRWERRTSYPTDVDGVHVEWFRAVRRLVPGLTLPLLPGLMDSLRRARPDVIHAHSHRYGHVLEAAVVAHNSRIPFVVSTHYHPAHRGEPALKRGLLRGQDHLFGSTAYRVADALVVETELEAQLVRKFAPSRAVRIIPPGVDLNEWGGPVGPLPPGIPSDYWLFVGRLAANKGLTELIEAYARLPVDGRRPLVLMGRDWGERAELERRASQLGVRSTTFFLGHISDPAVYRAVFRGARVFVLPSEWEAYGIVLLEAMAARVPIVATAVGGVSEVLENGGCGRLVPFGDRDALASSLRELDRDSALRDSLTKRATARVQELTWLRAVDRHRALYAELAN